MTSFTLAQQTVWFLASVAMGAVLAVAYDMVRAVRMLIRCSRAHILVSDILFFFFAGILTTLFALPFSKGDVRAFMVFGEAVGFLTYRLTLGSIFGKFYAVIARLLRQFIRKICEKLKKIYDFLLKAGAFLLYNILEAIDRFRRTARSGVRMLAAERRSAWAKKHGSAEYTKRAHPRRKRIRPPHRNRGGASQGSDPHKSIKYYEIPRIGTGSIDQEEL